MPDNLNDLNCVSRGSIGTGWVSVVVPTYNRSDLILATLESIISQSFRPIEIVVVDDGSTDDTLNVVHE